MGKIRAVCISREKGTPKENVGSGMLVEGFGLEGDAHGGNWHRQVSLLSGDKIDEFRKKIWVEYGAFGENLVVDGLDFRNLPVGSRFGTGDAVLEMTQIGKECHSDCIIRQKTGDCIMPREGVFARVLKGGKVSVGDELVLLPPEENPPLRAAVITLSDKGSRGEREDLSGPLIVKMLTEAGYRVEETHLLPDGIQPLKNQLIRLADGRQMDLAVYNIGGNTYFKLRDLAEALNGTGKQYNVGWDNESRQVAIESGQPYQPVAGDPTAPQSTVPSLGKQPSDAYVSFDGRKVEAEKYNINGNNYFKLRDLAQLLDFQVEWQQSSRSILIDTTKTYSPA